MELKFKKTENGYESKLSNDVFDRDYVNRSEIVETLINEKFWDFLKNVIEMEMEFPNGYTIDDKIYHDENAHTFGEWFIKLLKEDDEDGGASEIYKKVIPILKKYGFDNYLRQLID